MKGVPFSPVQQRARRQRVFLRLAEAAAQGARCPQADQFDHAQNSDIPVLAREGKIRVEVYGSNWRVVTILTGEHAGKKTAPPPFKNNGPYLVIDEHETRRNHRTTKPMEARQRPTAPRLLRTDEL